MLSEAITPFFTFVPPIPYSMPLCNKRQMLARLGYQSSNLILHSNPCPISVPRYSVDDVCLSCVCSVVFCHVLLRSIVFCLCLRVSFSGRPVRQLRRQGLLYAHI